MRSWFSWEVKKREEIFSETFMVSSRSTPRAWIFGSELKLTAMRLFLWLIEPVRFFGHKGAPEELLQRLDFEPVILRMRLRLQANSRFLGAFFRLCRYVVSSLVRLEVKLSQVN